MKKQVTVLYDGECPPCQRAVHHYRRLDRTRVVRWADISPAGLQLDHLCVTRAEAMARSHVLDRGGQMQTGAAAFVALCSALPYYRRSVAFICFPGLVSLLERLSVPLARWRLCQRRNSCPA